MRGKCPDGSPKRWDKRRKKVQRSHPGRCYHPGILSPSLPHHLQAIGRRYVVIKTLSTERKKLQHNFCVVEKKRRDSECIKHGFSFHSCVFDKILRFLKDLFIIFNLYLRILLYFIIFQINDVFHNTVLHKKHACLDIRVIHFDVVRYNNCNRKQKAVYEISVCSCCLLYTSRCV